MKALLTAPLFLAISLLDAATPEIAGPLVGNTTSKEVTLWMYAPITSQCSFSYHSEESSPAGKRTGKFTAISDQAAKGLGQIFKSTSGGLSPDTRYRYQVSVDGKSDPAWEGSFKTAPLEGEPTAFKPAITSCMRHGKNGNRQGSWDLLLAEQPDIHLTVGDTHYAGTTDPTEQLKHPIAYRRVKEFAKVLRHVPIYAIWDDHDYGPNNSDGTAEGKEFSLADWKHAWPNPVSGTSDTPGAFFKFSRGDVDFSGSLSVLQN